MNYSLVESLPSAGLTAECLAALDADRAGILTAGQALARVEEVIDTFERPLMHFQRRVGRLAIFLAGQERNSSLFSLLDITQQVFEGEPVTADSDLVVNYREFRRVLNQYTQSHEIDLRAVVDHKKRTPTISRKAFFLPRDGVS